MNPELFSYVLQSLIWSGIGFMVGFLLGRTGREVHEIKEAVVAEEESAVETGENHGPQARDFTRALGVAVILLSIFSVSQAWYTINENRDQVECQIQYNQTVGEITQQRGRLADEDRASLLAFLSLPLDATRKQRRDAYLHMVEVYQRNTELRKEHPIPEIPGGDCR